MKNRFSGRRSPSQIDLLLDQYERSELSGAEFARQQGLCYGTFCRWRREREQPDRRPVTPQLEAVPLGSLLGGTWAVEITWPDGPTLRLQSSVPAAWVGQLIEAVRRPC